MSIKFEIAKTLHGSPDERFIQLKGESYKVSSSDPDINWSPGFCRDSCDNPELQSNSMFEDSIRPLSIQVGSNQFWTFDTAWGLFELPNHKVSELIEKKFINKYGVDNIITHKYESKKNGQPKAYLLVIKCSALITVYSTIILASKLSRDYIDTDKLYIGVNNDENMKHNIITDCGRTKHYYRFPEQFKKVSELYDLKDREDLFSVKSESYGYDVKNIKGIASAEHNTKDGRYDSSITLDEEYSKKFGNILNDKLDTISRDDIVFFIKFKRALQSYTAEKTGKVSLSSYNGKGEKTEHTLDDIIKKIELAESKVLKLG
jgi:hypothetical protein